MPNGSRCPLPREKQPRPSRPPTSTEGGRERAWAVDRDRRQVGSATRRPGALGPKTLECPRNSEVQSGAGRGGGVQLGGWCGSVFCGLRCVVERRGGRFAGVAVGVVSGVLGSRGRACRVVDGGCVTVWWCAPPPRGCQAVLAGQPLGWWVVPSVASRARFTAAASRLKSASTLVCPRTRARRPPCRRRIR